MSTGLVLERTDLLNPVFDGVVVLVVIGVVELRAARADKMLDRRFDRRGEIVFGESVAGLARGIGVGCRRQIEVRLGDFDARASI